MEAEQCRLCPAGTRSGVASGSCTACPVGTAGGPELALERVAAVARFPVGFGQPLLAVRSPDHLSTAACLARGLGFDCLGVCSAIAPAEWLPPFLQRFLGKGFPCKLSQPKKGMPSFSDGNPLGIEGNTEGPTNHSPPGLGTDLLAVRRFASFVLAGAQVSPTNSSRCFVCPEGRYAPSPDMTCACLREGFRAASHAAAPCFAQLNSHKT